jgi:acyl-coenzyme A thioesterase PaaI-like protein
MSATGPDADSDFDRATAVRPRDGGRSFDVDIDPSWTIGPDKPNGGYLLAILGRAAVEAVAAAGGTQPHVVAANVSYVSSPDVGPAVAEVEVLRVGRTASQARARLVQHDQVTVDAMFTVGRLQQGSDPWWGEAPAVELADEEHATTRRLPANPDPSAGPTMRDRVMVKFDPSSLGFTTGTPAGRGEFKGWLRFADGRDHDPLSLLFAVDAFPPATFDLVSTGWVPTLNLTAYLRAVPAPGPLRMRFRVGVVQDGFADEVMEVWDSAGRLVAQSTQLTALRIPEGTPRPGATG